MQALCRPPRQRSGRPSRAVDLWPGRRAGSRPCAQRAASSAAGLRQQLAWPRSPANLHANPGRRTPQHQPLTRPQQQAGQRPVLQVPSQNQWPKSAAGQQVPRSIIGSRPHRSVMQLRMTMPMSGQISRSAPTRPLAPSCSVVNTKPDAPLEGNTTARAVRLHHPMLGGWCVQVAAFKRAVEQEDAVLPRYWQRVAKHVPGKTFEQCYKKVCCTVDEAAHVLLPQSSTS